MTQSNIKTAQHASVTEKPKIQPFAIPTDQFTLQEAEKMMLFVVENYDVNIEEWADEFESEQDNACQPSHEYWNYCGVSVDNETYWSDNSSHFGDNILRSKETVEAYLRGFSFEEKPKITKQQGTGKKGAQKKAASSSHVKVVYAEEQEYSIAGAISLQFTEKEVENKNKKEGKTTTEGFVVIHTNKVQTHKKGCTKTVTEVIEIPFKDLWIASFINPKGAKGVTDTSYVFSNGKLVQKNEHYL